MARLTVGFGSDIEFVVWMVLCLSLGMAPKRRNRGISSSSMTLPANSAAIKGSDVDVVNVLGLDRLDVVVSAPFID